MAEFSGNSGTIDLNFYEIAEHIDEEYILGPTSQTASEDESESFYFAVLAAVGLIVNIYVLHLLITQKQENREFINDITRVLTGLNLIQSTIVLTVLSYWFSKREWTMGSTACKLHQFSKSFVSISTGLLISLACLTKYMTFINQLRFQGHMDGISPSNQCRSERIKIFICLLIGGLCAAPDLWIYQARPEATEFSVENIFEDKTRIQCLVTLEKIPEADLNVSVSAQDIITEEPEMDFETLWLTEAVPPSDEKINIEKLDEIEELIGDERFTMREYRLFTIFVNFFLPVTIIISCYTAITIHLLDRTKSCVNQREVHVRIKCNPFRIENFYKNTLILSTSFIGLSAPLYVLLSKDWSKSTQDQSSRAESETTDWRLYIVCVLHYCVSPLLYGIWPLMNMKKEAKEQQRQKDEQERLVRNVDPSSGHPSHHHHHKITTIKQPSVIVNGIHHGHRNDSRGIDGSGTSKTSNSTRLTILNDSYS